MKHKLGNWYKIERDIYVIAAVAPYKIALISIENGTRRTESIEVVDCPNVNEAEFERLVGNIKCIYSFIESAEIIVGKHTIPTKTTLVIK